jgi:hypothetical protein
VRAANEEQLPEEDDERWDWHKRNLQVPSGLVNLHHVERSATVPFPALHPHSLALHDDIGAS